MPPLTRWFHQVGHTSLALGTRHVAGRKSCIFLDFLSLLKLGHLFQDYGGVVNFPYSPLFRPLQLALWTNVQFLLALFVGDARRELKAVNKEVKLR